MGREVRRVPATWQHPKDGSGQYIPLFDGYNKRKTEFEAMQSKDGLQAALDYYGHAPNQTDHMPDWPDIERTHLMMYEDTSEGTPISPAFKTAEELAQWLADTGASAFGSMTDTYENWLATIKAGWAVGMVVDANGERPGTSIMGERS